MSSRKHEKSVHNHGMSRPRCSRRCSTLVMLVLAAVFTTSLIIYIFQSIKRSPVVDRELHHNAFDLSLHTFIEAARRSSYHAYDSEEIKRVCLASKWRTNVATHCGLLSGDIATMRQAILACLFSAMRNGTDFVLPKISLQDPMKLQVTGDIVVSMDHLFDTAILRARLSEDCPEMTVHDELSTVNAENVEIQDFDPSGQQESLICDSTSPGFPRALAGVLHFRSSIVTVAFTALYTVAKDFSLPIRPAFNELSRFSYLGIAFPSTQFSTSEYMEQLQYYINLSNWGLFSSVVYVTSSTSNFHSVAEVSRYANKHFGSLTVLTHKKLLARQSTKYVTALERMSTEQREVIDYIMLENAAYFTSLTRNALALSVAVARAGRRTDDAAICGQLKRTRAWRDGWSELPAKDDDAPATFFWP